MDMEPVESSNIREVGYDPISETMRVVFRSGSVYDYFGVPQNTHDELMSSDSRGSYLSRRVIGVHDHKRVDE